MTERRTAGFRELEEVVGEQTERIAELTRTCASLVEDNKAFRQRVEREKDRVLEAERVKLAQTLFETHDDIDMALRASSGDSAGDAPALADLREGVRLTQLGLEKRIGELGATRVAVVGLPYDPRTGDAIDLVPVDDPRQDGIVVEEVRPGWRIGDRLLRPARVRVGKLVAG